MICERRFASVCECVLGGGELASATPVSSSWCSASKVKPGGPVAACESANAVNFKLNATVTGVCTQRSAASAQYFVTVQPVRLQWGWPACASHASPRRAGDAPGATAP